MLIRAILGNSTLFKILNDCAASVRKSMEGLDYYIAEGGRAFQELEEILGDISDQETTELKQDLLGTKHYLKTDYKVLKKLRLII